MGQKLTEHPVVDQWLRYAREADRAGAQLPRRKSADRLELEKFAAMQRARTRLLVSKPALPEPQSDPAKCVKCGARLRAGDRKRRPVRSIYEAGGKTDYWRCSKCAGVR